MNTPEDTFRTLKKLTFMDLYNKFMSTDIPARDHKAFIENHGWEINEFLRQCKIYQGSISYHSL